MHASNSRLLSRISTNFSPPLNTQLVGQQRIMFTESRQKWKWRAFPDTSVRCPNSKPVY